MSNVLLNFALIKEEIKANRYKMEQEPLFFDAKCYEGAFTCLFPDPTKPGLGIMRYKNDTGIAYIYVSLDELGENEKNIMIANGEYLCRGLQSKRNNRRGARIVSFIKK